MKVGATFAKKAAIFVTFAPFVVKVGAIFSKEIATLIEFAATFGRCPSGLLCEIATGISVALPLFHGGAALSEKFADVIALARAGAGARIRVLSETVTCSSFLGHLLAYHDRFLLAERSGHHLCNDCGARNRSRQEA